MAARPVATLLSVVVVIGTLLLAGASAQSSPPPSGCTSVLVSLSPCLNYISGNESAAPASCCAQLGTVVRSDPRCLCVAFNADPAALGLNVNRTRALGLPDACKVKTPPVGDCKRQAGAAASGSSTGSKSTPSTGFENGAAASARGSAAGFVVVAAVLAVAACHM